MLRHIPKPLIDRRILLRLRTVPALFFFLLVLSGTLLFFLVKLHDPLNICLVDQQISLLIFELVVVGIQGFFLRHQFRAFGFQALDRGQFFQSQIVKSFLCCLVDDDLAFVFVVELL